jgi:hypothetical protein
MSTLRNHVPPVKDSLVLQDKAGDRTAFGDRNRASRQAAISHPLVASARKPDMATTVCTSTLHSGVGRARLLRSRKRTHTLISQREERALAPRIAGPVLAGDPREADQTIYLWPQGFK